MNNANQQNDPKDTLGFNQQKAPTRQNQQNQPARQDQGQRSQKAGSDGQPKNPNLPDYSDRPDDLPTVQDTAKSGQQGK